MPYIVQNPSGVVFENNLLFGTNSINFGTLSDLGNINGVQVYTTDSTLRTSILHSNDFLINGKFSPNMQEINSTYTTVLGLGNVIIGSFSSTTDIWLATASRVEGMEIVIRRLDGNAATTVTVRSSQTDINQSPGSLVNNFSLPSGQRCRLVRIGGAWYRYYQGG